MIKLVHYIDNLGIGGGQSALFELYLGLKTYFGNKVDQEVWTANNSNLGVYSGYEREYYRNAIKQDRVLSPEACSEVDIIIIHALFSTDIEGMTIGLECPIIILNHTYPGIRTIRGNYDVIVAVSRHMGKELLLWNAGKRVVLIRNGINGFRKTHTRHRRHTVEGRKEPCLLTGRINRIASGKHPDDWFKDLDFKLPLHHIHQYIGGDSKEKDINRMRKRLLKKHHPEHYEVDIVGNISFFQKKMSWIKRWDLMVYGIPKPEGISMGILEALSLGVPVLCNDVPANSEIIVNGVNGYVWHNFRELRYLLDKLCRCPSRLDLLSETTLEHFKGNLDASYSAAKYFKLITELINSRSKK